MEKVRAPYFKVLYEGKDITADVSNYLLQLVFSDKEEGESDSLEIQLEDVDGLWRGQWYPEKGSKLEAEIGFEDGRLNCGTFEIDQIDLSGPPDVVSIKALAAGLKGALRTKRSDAHEKKTLLDIARKVAQRNGLTVTGEVPDVRFDRVTQNRETDLAFLRRISAEYGCIFSVRDKKLIFTTIYDIEDRTPSTEVDRLDIARYAINDKGIGTFKDAKVSYHDPKEKKVVETKFENSGSFAYSNVAAGDSAVIHTKAENKQQAEKKAKAALHKANSYQQEGSIDMEGNPLMVAGNNFTLSGMGVLSGLWHIVESKHTITRSGGYTTEVSVKRVKKGEEAKQGSTKRDKQRLDASRQPSFVYVQSEGVDRREQSRIVPGN